MLCFDVRVNGERVAVAGVSEGVLSTTLSHVGRPPTELELNLEIGAFIQSTHLSWADRPLRMGDRIEVVIVDAETADPPIREHRDPEGLRERAERRYYETLKQKYGP